MLKHHVDSILQVCLGDKFPETGVGTSWTNRFLSRHSDQLGAYWSSALEAKCGRAVNKNTNEAWLKLLQDTMITEHGITPDCIWAADETGFQQGTAVKERVCGAANQKIQHQQRDGSRENITVMVAICADDNSIAPAIICKGQGFSTNWHKDNDLKAS